MPQHLIDLDTLTDQQLMRLLVTPRKVLAPSLTARTATTLRTATTDRTAPPPPDYNAAIRAAMKVNTPTPSFVHPRTAGHGAPKPPTNADYNAAVSRKAQAAHTRR